MHEPRSEAGPQRGQTVEPRRWWVLAVMSVGTLIVFLDDTVVNTALPRIAVDLDASTSALQWVIDAYVLALAGLLLLCGSIGDRYGRKRTMTIGLVVFGLAASGAALADSTALLVAMRACQGLGAALVLPATLSIITNVFPRHERTTAIAVWTAVGGLGVGLGPVVGGALVDHASWSAAFWLFVPVVVAAIAGMAVVPESRDERRVGLDVPGAVIGTAGLTTLVYAIIRGGEAGWGRGTVVAAFGAAAVLLAAFAAVEAWATAPMLPLGHFRQRDFSGAVLVIGIVFFSMFVSFFFLTQFFQLVQGRSALEAGLLVVAPAVGMIVGSGLAGKLLAPVGPRVLTIAMTATMALALLLLTRITVGSSALQIDIALGIIGLGAGLGLPALTDTVMAAVPERDAGIGSAVNDVSRQLGGALGIAVIGSVVNNGYRTRLSDRVPATIDPDVVHTAREGIGVAARATGSLPSDSAADLARVAGHAYVDAITQGFAVSAVVMVGALVVATTMLPKRMRSRQADGDPDDDPGLVGAPTPDDSPAPTR
jgi:EmrB/QacA subfamily drug resistance transporter